MVIATTNKTPHRITIALSLPKCVSVLIATAKLLRRAIRPWTEGLNGFTQPRPSNRAKSPSFERTSP